MIATQEVRYLVHYVPDKRLTEKILELQDILSKEDTLMKTYHLHCTVLVFDSFQTQEKDISDSFSKSKFLPPQIFLTYLDTFYENMLVVRTEKNKEISKNHFLSLKHFTPYINHNSSLTKEMENWPMTLDQRDAFIRHGSPFVGSFYNPHVSLGKSASNQQGQHKHIKFFYGMRWEPKEIYLSKKTSEEWEEIRKLYL